MKTVFCDASSLVSHAVTQDDVVVVMPFIDEAMARQAAALMAARTGADGLLLAVHDQDREGFIAIANRSFAAAGGTWFGYVAQDAFPGRQWLALALKALRSGEKNLLGFNDGKWMGALASFGLARRQWAQGNYAGALFHAGYHSHFADAELTVLALNDRSYCYDPNSVLVEVDWGKDKAAVNAADRALYRQRAAAGFEGRIANRGLLDLFS